MNRSYSILILFSGLLLGWHAVVPNVNAQQAQVSLPHFHQHHSWYENMGSSMFLDHRGRRGGWFFSWGAPVIPPYGGYDGHDARFGFGFRNGPLRGGFNFWASQGSNRSMVMTAPYIVVPHGGFGMIRQGSWRPFVTGWFPVVGGQPQWHSPLETYLNSPEAESYVRQRAVQNPHNEPIQRLPQTLEKPKTDPPLRLIDGQSDVSTGER